MSALDAAERLREDVSTVLEAGRSSAREYGAAGASFRKLLLSDIALARVALIRGLVFLLICVAMAGTAWVAAMVLLVLGLNELGLPLLAALLPPLLASAAAAYYAWTVAREAWKTLKITAKESATPWRIVTVGAVAGFLMGRSGGGGNNSGSVGAKLFGTVAQALITTLGAAGTAGAAAASAADAAADATTE